MKKIIALAIVCAFVFTCGGDESPYNATLQIANETSKTLDNVYFQDILFTAPKNGDVVGNWKASSTDSSLSISDAMWIFK
jgi:hypothetical protein